MPYIYLRFQRMSLSLTPRNSGVIHFSLSLMYISVSSVWHLGTQISPLVWFHFRHCWRDKSLLHRNLIHNRFSQWTSQFHNVLSVVPFVLRLIEKQSVFRASKIYENTTFLHSVHEAIYLPLPALWRSHNSELFLLCKQITCPNRGNCVL